MLSCKVKASQVTNLTDARYYAAWEVDWIGFPSDPGQEDYLEAPVIHAMREWIEGPKIVAEYESLSTELVKSSIDQLKPDAIQLGPFYSLEDLDALSSIPIIKMIVIQPDSSLTALENELSAFENKVELFLIDFLKNGISWDKLQDHPEFDPDVLLGLCSRYPILFSIDVLPEKILEMLRVTKAYGINLYGSEEEATGVKSFEEIDELIETLYLEE